MTVADFIISEVSRHTSAIFGLTGGLCMAINDAVARSSLQYVGHHHELAAVIAADGYARQSSRLGVAMLTGGPGLPWGCGGIVGAYQDSIPLLVLVGQAKRQSTIAGTGLPCRQVGTFECDAIQLVQPVTKYAARLTDPGNVAATMELAFDAAMGGRPGPVVIECPLDVQGSQVRSE